MSSPNTALADPDEYLANFTRRVIADALAEAHAARWLARAQQLEDARPKPSDHNGRATPAMLAETDYRIAEKARACRYAAAVAIGTPEAIIRRHLAEIGQTGGTR